MKFIQFIGTQRSGSNLLRLMLNQLEGVVAPHPPHILDTFFPLINLYGDLEDEHNFFALVKDVCTLVTLNPVPWNVAVLDPVEIRRRCQSNSLIEIFKVIYEGKAKLKNAQLWCCKSMANVHYAKAIEEAGLAPKYIHLYRDGRDVALSFQRAIVGHKHIYPLAKKWKEDQLKSIQLIKRVGPQLGFSVSYEKLLHDPVDTMKEICDFIEVPYSPNVMDFYHSKESDLAAKSGTMWRNLVKPLMTDNIGKYKHNLSQDEILLFESVAHDVLCQLGYVCENMPDKFVNISTELEQSYMEQDKALIKGFVSGASKEDIQQRLPRQQHLQEIKARLAASINN